MTRTGIPTALLLAAVTLLVIVIAGTHQAARAGLPSGCAIFVNSPGDDITADEVVTLREAMAFVTDAAQPAPGELGEISGCPGDSDNPGAGMLDLIFFQASVFPQATPVTITLNSTLPTLTDSDAINASGAGVVVDGVDQSFDCIDIASDSNAIIGLHITGCRVGVVIGGFAGPLSAAMPQSASPANDNQILGNVVGGNVVGIGIGALSENNAIAGNLIGTDTDGESADPNEVGISLQNTRGNSIGPLSSSPLAMPAGVPYEGNVISGNEDDGIAVLSGQFDVIHGNMIGLDATGSSALPNGDDGVYVESPVNVRIGGAIAEERNIISGNGGDGVELRSAAAIPVGRAARPQGFGPIVPAIVQGNFIGTSADGTAVIGNQSAGVRITDIGLNLIGGDAPGEGNVIAGGSVGVRIAGDAAEANVVRSNRIGTGPAGGPGFGQSAYGVLIAGAPENTIGGASPNAGNVIVSAALDGILIIDGAQGNQVWGNHIGVLPGGTTPLPNGRHGVHAENAGPNEIGGSEPEKGNVIAFNAGDGVAIVAAPLISQQKSILSNSIYANGGLGIDLEDDGVSLNDAGDPDDGANAGQNYPVLVAALSENGATAVQGTLNSTPNTGFRIQFFRSSECDPSGYGEGQDLLGGVVATTDFAGNDAFAVVLPETGFGDFITATATDPLGNTSEFSECFPVTVGSFTYLWGSIDCDEDVEADDVLKGLLVQVNISISQQPGCPTPAQAVLADGQDEIWADWDCSGAVEGPDFLRVLAYLAGVPPVTPGGCFPIATAVEIETPQ